MLRHDSEHSSSSVNDTKLGDPALFNPAIKSTRTGAGDADDARTSPVSLCKRRVFTVVVGLTRMKSSLLGAVEVGCHYNESREVLMRLAPDRQVCCGKDSLQLLEENGINLLTTLWD